MQQIGDSERRAARRVKPSRPVGIKVRASLPARLVDISSRGAQLEVATCLKPDAPSELRFQLADGEINVKAHVKRCRAWGFGLDDRSERVLLYRAGVEFAGIDRATVARLRQYFLLPESGVFTEEDIARKAAEVATKERTPDDLVRGILEASGVPTAPRRDGPVRIRISSSNIKTAPKEKTKK
jgi:hypothetical protein